MRTKQRERSVTVAEIVNKALEFDLDEFLTTTGDSTIETNSKFFDRTKAVLSFEALHVEVSDGEALVIGNTRAVLRGIYDGAVGELVPFAGYACLVRAMLAATAFRSVTTEQVQAAAIELLRRADIC